MSKKPSSGGITAQLRPVKAESASTTFDTDEHALQSFIYCFNLNLTKLFYSKPQLIMTTVNQRQVEFLRQLKPRLKNFIAAELECPNKF